MKIIYIKMQIIRKNAYHADEYNFKQNVFTSQYNTIDIYVRRYINLIEVLRKQFVMIMTIKYSNLTGMLDIL